MRELIERQDYRAIFTYVTRLIAQKNLVLALKSYRYEDIQFETVTTKGGTYVKATATADDCYLFSLGRRLLYNIGEKGQPLGAPVVSDGLHLGVVMATLPMSDVELWYNTQR